MISNEYIVVLGIFSNFEFNVHTAIAYMPNNDMRKTFVKIAF